MFLVIILALGTVFSITNMTKAKSILTTIVWAIASTSYLLVTIGTFVKFIIERLGI